ncbi:MAG: serine/threonine-protein kinase [Polyangiaceae bacterium]
MAETDSDRTSRPPPFPERLGRYEVLIPVASGGMATVYLARAQGLAGFEHEVALKLTHGHLREDSEFVESLMDEARLAGRIRHPNVVSVLDVGEDPHGVFIVMEYVEGDSLANVLRLLRDENQRVPPDIALRLLDDVLMGLHAAHELRDESGQPMNVVHRDVTPHNILVGLDGIARLTDFGIAKAATRLSNTSTGLVKGKIAYMAPEQAQGRPIDRRCDVWAAGVVAWETLAGTRMYEGPNEAAILLKIVREPPTRLRTVRRDLPTELDNAVAKALQLNVQHRYESAEQFAQGLMTAAAAGGLRPAERRDVSAYLEPLLEPRLRARRTKMLEIQALRRRMGELAAPNVATASSTGMRVPRPTGADSEPPPEGTATIAMAEPMPAEGTRTVLSEPPGTEARTAGAESSPATQAAATATVSAASAAVMTATVSAAPAAMTATASATSPTAMTETVSAASQATSTVSDAADASAALAATSSYDALLQSVASEQEQTGSAGISNVAHSILAPPRRTGTVVIVGVLIAAGLLGLIAIVAMATGDESDAVATQPSARVEPQRAPAAPATRAPTPGDLASPSASTVDSATPQPASPPAGTKKPRFVPAARPQPRPVQQTPKSTSGTPLSNPYKSK